MCSGIRIISENGTIVIGRTMEFGQNILKFRKFSKGNIKGISTPDGKILDGINQAGLVVFVFYFPKFAKYGGPRMDKLNVKPTDFAMMVLEKAQTIDDVIDMLPKIQIVHENYPPFVGTPPMHWMITDASGKSVVLEPTGEGEITAYENTLGIFTNSPSFPEHVKEANEILPKLSNLSNPDAISQGTGADGLPGDFSSVSRFIRLAFFAENIVKPKNSADAINSLIHVLNNFDIPVGAVASVDPKTGKHVYETTIYTSYYNITNRSLLYKDHENQQVRVIN
jgi:penicillin V acylase-like amidase (Ntn superfamily)